MNAKNEQGKKFLPIWLWVIVLIEIIIVLFFSISTAMSPADFLPGVSELDYVSQLYINRNLTAVLGLILALLFRSHKALLVVLLIRMATDLADVFTVYAYDAEAIKASVPMVVVLLLIIPLFAVRYLWQRIQADA
jgi:hypothetical protein